ncbi:MAG: glycosyltransferase, partial [Saprospiraceae bacterium]
MGHATRSMPLIHRFLERGNEVFLASDGRALKLLESEFPQLICLELPAYNITYRSSNMILNMAVQMPRITYAALTEHRRIQQWQKQYKFDMILSDNRFGTFHPKVKSVFMSHQLNLPIDNPFFAWVGNLANRFWMSRYNEIWVPDFEGENNISGKLSHPSPFKNTKYLGVLTRFKNIDLIKKYKITIILSGPEPM